MGDKVKKNLKTSKLITFYAYLLGGICFLLAYFLSNIIWFLVAACVLITSAIAFLYLFKWIERKLTK